MVDLICQRFTTGQTSAEPASADDKGRLAGKSRDIPWAELLRRTFGF
jgi:hypothetical protein